MSRPCRQLQGAVHRLADDELTGGQALALRLHATSCPPCQDRVEGAGRLARTLRHAGARTVEPPADLPARILASLPAAARPAPWRRRAALAAAVLAGPGTAALLLARLAGAAAGGMNDPVLAGARSALGTAVGWLGRFDALLQLFAGAASLPAALPTVPAVTSLLPAVALIATGLLGAMTALSLTAAPRLSGSRRASS